LYKLIQRRVREKERCLGGKGGNAAFYEQVNRRLFLPKKKGHKGSVRIAQRGKKEKQGGHQIYGGRKNGLTSVPNGGSILYR